MFGGMSSVPNEFYIIAITFIVLLVIFIEWKTR